MKTTSPFCPAKPISNWGVVFRQGLRQTVLHQKAPLSSDLCHTVILALGNPLRGDDGVGVAVLEQLAQADLPPGVALLDGGTPGLETVLLLQDYQRAVIVDAAEMGYSPGQWRSFTREQAELHINDLGGTLHQAGLAEAMALGEALGILPDEILIYGVQPEMIGWEPGLSDPVKVVIAEISAAILDWLQNEVKDHA
jgi:hydrogenase maturation protease